MTSNVLIAAIVACGCARADDSVRIDTSGLTPGPFAVGYRHLYELDPARAWQPFPAREGENPDGTERRPIRIGVWYPAVASDLPPMPYREYVTPDAPDDYFGRLNEVMARYDLWSYATMFADDLETRERLLGAATGAVLNAGAAPGRFPVVLYSAGWYSRSPDNTVWAEHLASHGYVVVTVPQLGPGVVEYDFRVTPERVETQMEDLRFALEVVCRLRFADRDKVAAAGFSVGGIVALLLQQRDSRIDAVVGLDGSFLREDSVALMMEADGFSARASRVPILALYRNHERQRKGFSRQVLDALRHADRYLVAVEKATHGEFSNEPAIFAGLDRPWIRADWNSLSEAMTAHQAIIESTRLFLDGVFGRRPLEDGWMVRPSALEAGLAGFLAVERFPAEEAPAQASSAATWR